MKTHFPEDSVSHILVFYCEPCGIIWHPQRVIAKLQTHASYTIQTYSILIWWPLHLENISSSLFIKTYQQYNVIYRKRCIYQLISVYSLWHLRCSKRIQQALSSAPCWLLDRFFCLKYMSKSKNRVYWKKKGIY